MEHFELFPDELVRSGEPGNWQVGIAGEMLVGVHLTMLGIEWGIMNGRHMDVIAFIHGRTMRIQVKASISSRSFGDCDTPARRLSRVMHSAGRNLLSYKGHIDAFAFCYLPDPYPYYMSIEAISNDREAFSPACFTKRGRDDSFKELLRRWREDQES